MQATAEVGAEGQTLAARPGGEVMAIATTSVGKTYRSRRQPITALEGVDLTVRPGEFVSILGPSGCGKSTLLAVVAGLEDATSGTVTVAGAPVEGPLVEAGFMFQRDLLLDWRTCERNVLLQFQMRGQDPRPHRERARSLLRMVGLESFAGKHPNELSGGMRQRVALCRALVHGPPVLFMDEPFGALDALTRESLNTELRRITRAQGTTVLLVTHSIDEAVFLSDRVVVMTPRPGRIVADVAVELPEPREPSVRGEPAFIATAARLREILDDQHREDGAPA